LAITFAEAKAIVWDAEAATWPLRECEIELLGHEVETHFLVVRGAKHPDRNPVVVAGGPGVIRALCRF
jgi:hypothetical protein